MSDFKDRIQPLTRVAEVSIRLSDNELAFLLQRSWYTENETIQECLRLSTEGEDIDEQLINLYRQKIVILEKDIERGINMSRNRAEVARCNTEIETLQNAIEMRKSINRWLREQDESIFIQSALPPVKASYK